MKPLLYANPAGIPLQGSGFEGFLLWLEGLAIWL